MKWITYIQDIKELDQINTSNTPEIICSCRDFSKDTNTSKSQLIEILTEAKSRGYRTLFEWDTVEVETQLDLKIKIFETLPMDLIDVIRVQDVGVMNYVFLCTQKPIHLIKENKDHNLIGLKKWESYLGDRCERICLSNELNKSKIKHYGLELNSQIEILGFGKILLFYTPRNLLSPLTEQTDATETLKAMGSSEESPHSGFPIKENSHGTFMYHIKDLYLLDKIEEIQKLGDLNLRVDLRDKDFGLITEVMNISTNAEGAEFKTKHIPKSTRGYFQTNKTDVLFKKLKNYRIQRKDSSYIGEIIEIQNKEYMALMVKSNEVKLKDELKIISPDGNEYTTHLASLRDSNMQDVPCVGKGQIAVMKYKGGVWPKSQVYFQ